MLFVEFLLLCSFFFFSFIYFQSYTQNDCYFNEIDALSCNNRPISSTLRGTTSYNAYESQTEDETTSYDLYGNQEYNDGSSCDSYNHHPQISTSTMSNAGNYNVTYYSSDDQYCKNVIATDNLMYHRDACSGDSSDTYGIYANTVDYGDFDNRRRQSASYLRGPEGNGGMPFSTLGGDGGGSNNKILPQVPQSNSMWDGMYTIQQRQSNVSLPSTPTFRYSGGGGVGGRGVAGAETDWDRDVCARRVKAQLNGQRHVHVGYGAYKLKSERALPLPQSPQPHHIYPKKTLKQQFFEDNTGNSSLTGTTTNTTSMSVYRNHINSDNDGISHQSFYYDNGECRVGSDTTSITYHTQMNSRVNDYNNTYHSNDRYPIEPRPHTAMYVPATEDYTDFGLSSMDNMSTYSDTTIPNTAFSQQQQQHKLQDLQKCRYSIIMAMTTASVIASGETRIPQHLLKKTTTATTTQTTTTTTSEATSLFTKNATNSSYSSSRYECVGFDAGVSSMMGDAYTTTFTGKLNNITTTLPAVTLANSTSMLLLSSASPIVASDADNNSSVISCSSKNINSLSTLSTTTATTTGTAMETPGLLLNSLTSRKLPKQLPSVQTTRSAASYGSKIPHNQMTSTTIATIATPTIATTLTPAANDTLSTINSTSSATTHAATFTSSSTTTTLSSPSSLLAYPGILAPSSLINPAAATTTTTTVLTHTFTPTSNNCDYLLPDNNNRTAISKHYDDNFNNCKNNFYNNNIENTIEDKYSINEYYLPPMEHYHETKSEKVELTDKLSNAPSRIVETSSHTLTSKELIASEEPYLKSTDMKTRTLVTTAENTSTTISEPLLKYSSTSPSSLSLTEQSMAILSTDYKTSYDYTDYFKPFTLATYSSSDYSTTTTTVEETTTSNGTSLTTTSSYIPPSYHNIENHTADFTQLPSSISTLKMPTTTTSVAINNSGLDNNTTTSTTALNFSDNISPYNIRRKSSISMNDIDETKIKSPNGSVVKIITSTSCYPTTLSSSSLTTATTSSSNVTTLTPSNVTSSTTSLDLELASLIVTTSTTATTTTESATLYQDYDNYLKDYKLDLVATTLVSSFTTPTSTTISTAAAAAATTTTSSLHINQSLPIITTQMLTKACNNNNNSNDLDVVQASTLITPATSLFTTTNLEPPENTLDTKATTATATTTATLNAAYSDYLKDFISVTSSSSLASFESDLEFSNEMKVSTELPDYLKAFDLTYLDQYKMPDANVSQTSPSTANTTIKDNTIVATTTSFSVDDNTELKLSLSPAQVDHQNVLNNRETDLSLESLETANTINTFTFSAAATETSPLQATTTKDPLTANTALTIVDFDDSFYNSFSVNLNSLIVDTTTSATSTTTTTTTSAMLKDNNQTPAMSTTAAALQTGSNETNLMPTTSVAMTTLQTRVLEESPNKSLYTTSSINSLNDNSGGSIGDYYSPNTSVVTSSFLSSATSTPQKTSTAPTGNTLKASSVLGGLSQSLKGGLDGVLGGVGSGEPQQTKKSFGFGFTSKLVPNVGNLLAAATKSTPPAAATTTNSTRDNSNTVTTTSPYANSFGQPVTTQEAFQQQLKFNNVTTTNTGDYLDELSNSTLATTTTNFDIISDEYYNNNSIVTCSNNANIYDNSATTTTMYVSNGANHEGSNVGLYYSSQPAFYHVTSSFDYSQDEMCLNPPDQMLLYDETSTNIIQDPDKDYYNDESHNYDEYASFSEPELATYTTSSLQPIAETAAYTQSTKTTAAAATAASSANTNSATVTAAKKATSSLFSSLTNVASQISQPTPAAAVTTGSSTPATTAAATKASTGGGGMFGSIFGKAAAAMQTATQVVNQGASLAQTKVQKNIPVTSQANTTTSAALTSTTATKTSAGSTSNFTRGSMQRDSLASPYSLSNGFAGDGNDYENSNMHKLADDFDHQQQRAHAPQHLDLDEEEEYYYSNQNQNQQQPIPQMKILPTVPSAGSTGKKLPTINDKSGCLVKQQPTEQYDEVVAELGNKFSAQPLKREAPTYDIDSEQGDYYMDPQPAAPSSSSSSLSAAPTAMVTTSRPIATNGYYEHTNGGYDYRDDYFNEEDEFKYLEKEEIHNQQLRQMHKQSSLQYVVEDEYNHVQSEIMDEYMDEMYHSEDSDNYLDESSSGSVKGIGSSSSSHLYHQQPQTTISTTTTSSSSAVKDPPSGIASTTHIPTSTTSSMPHHQIKKQDSIILEEDEKDDLDEHDDLHDLVGSPSQGLSRKSSHILNEDDQIGEMLPPSFNNLRSSQSRKPKLIRGETEEVVGGHMQIMKRKTEVSAKQRWHWAYNKIIMQLNVSTFCIE